MKNIAVDALSICARSLFVASVVVLTGCALPRAANAPVVYDFGPGALHTPASTRMAKLPPLELGTPHSTPALNTTAVLYRLAYADAQALKPYALARWSMPPAQLIGQRLRERLGQSRVVVAPGDLALTRPARAPVSATAPVAATPAGPTLPDTVLSLRLDLEEFSQLFESADKSSGLLRLRATVARRSAVGEALLAQHSFVVQQTAISPDASGGVRALTAAVEQAVGEIEGWLGAMER